MKRGPRGDAESHTSPRAVGFEHSGVQLISSLARQLH